MCFIWRCQKSKTKAIALFAQKTSVKPEMVNLKQNPQES